MLQRYLFVKFLGQERLKESAVLVIGAGGLGSPACLYLAAAGVKTLGIVDYDVVELDNLHRQVLHAEDRVGVTKTQSAIQTLKRINSACMYKEHACLLDWQEALRIIPKYDLVVDGSDNAVTRYIVNDACVLLGKPLVSGAALRFDGQLTTYHYKGSACYRCIYPEPPPPQAVVNCQFGGVLGPITGTMGSLQALEAIRILAMGESNYAGKMLKFDGLTGSFRTFKLRNRREDCAVCGDRPTIRLDSDFDYEVFCGSKANDKCQNISILSPSERITCRELVEKKSLDDYCIVDVRPPGHFDIVRFPEAINISIDQCLKRIEEIRELASQKNVLVVCRAGNDSQLATRIFKDHGIENVVDLVGGMNAYAACIDLTLPRY